MFDTNKGALSLDAAASIINESIETTRRMVFEGQLQGILAHDGRWWVLQESIEQYLGYPITIHLTNEPGQ